MLVLACTVAILPTAAAAFQIVSATRHVTIDGHETGSVGGDALIRFLYAACNDSVVVDETSGSTASGAFGAALSASEADFCGVCTSLGCTVPTFSAAQSSSIDGHGVIQASGSQSVLAWYELFELSEPPSNPGWLTITEGGTSTTHFETSFEITEPTPYVLTGLLESTVLGFSAGGGVTFALQGPSGSVHQWVIGGDPFTGPESEVLDEAGTLAPGVYTVLAVATGSADSATEPFSFDGGGAAALFDFELLLVQAPVSVPVSGTWGAWLLCTALGASAVRWLTRRQSVTSHTQ